MNKFFLIFIITIIFSCENPRELVIHSGLQFGTYYNIKRENIGVEHKKIQLGIDSLFRVINSSMSTYLPNSLISKINDGKENVELDDHFLNVFNKSSQVFSITNGYFDPTVGSLVNAYGFGPSGGIKKISPFQIDSIKKLIGWEKLNLVGERLISKQHPNIFIDFNSIAKGYMIDIIDKYLIRLGSENHLIDIGGEIKGTGINITTKKKWKIAIDYPEKNMERKIINVVSIKNQAIATSGNYRKFKIDSLTGQMYVHLINPLKGLPSKSSILSVSVISKDCMTADAFATALMVMPIELGKKIVNENDFIEAYWIISNGKEVDEVFSKKWKSN